VSALAHHWPAALMQALQKEPAVVRIVLAEVQGSAPREPGVSMLVSRCGSEGTIGGGQLEWDMVAEARSLLEDTQVAARVWRRVLGADLGQCCGGVVRVWMERFTRADLELLLAASEAAVHDGAVLISRIEQAGVARRVVRDLGVAPAADRLLRAPRLQALPSLSQSADGPITLCERLDDEMPAVWLYGAGHVGQALARILAELPLRLTWIDLRTGIFSPASFKGVRILNDADPVASVAAAPRGVHFIVMTHSHPLDYALCRAILQRNDFAWAGLIGSMSKAARFRSRLARDAVGRDAIARLTCPIGVGGIASKWPAAIAVAVAAQLLQEISAGVRQVAQTAPYAMLAPCTGTDCASCGSTS
jgi:xanthine dehydrogenase accessory factor